MKSVVRISAKRSALPEAGNVLRARRAGTPALPKELSQGEQKFLDLVQAGGGGGAGQAGEFAGNHQEIVVAREHEFVAFGFDDGDVFVGGDEFQLGGFKKQLGRRRQGAETVAEFVFQVAQGGGIGGLGEFAVDLNAMAGFGDVGGGEGGGGPWNCGLRAGVRLPIAY